MNWDEVFINIRAMKNMTLQSISGKSNLVLLDIDDQRVRISTSNGLRTRLTAELRQIVDNMELFVPVHVDTILSGSGSSRNQPETIISNLPDVEWTYINKRKHLVWIGHKSHDIATIRQIDTIIASQLKFSEQTQNVGASQGVNKILVIAKDVRSASLLMTRVLQSKSPKPLPMTQGYVISNEHNEVLLIPDITGKITDFEIIPIVEVPDITGALARTKDIFPSITIQNLNLGNPIFVIQLPWGEKIALEQH